MQTARLRDLFAHQGLKECTALEKGLGGQVAFPHACEERTLGLAAFFVLEELLATRLNDESGLNPACTDLSTCSAKKTPRNDFLKAP
jgi:hypothetical protein